MIFKALKTSHDRTNHDNHEFQEQLLVFIGQINYINHDQLKIHQLHESVEKQSHVIISKQVGGVRDISITNKNACSNDEAKWRWKFEPVSYTNLKEK